MHALAAKAIAQASGFNHGFAWWRTHQPISIKQGRNGVQHNDYKDRLNHAGGCVRTYRFGTAGDLEAFQATNCSDQEGKNGALANPTRKCLASMSFCIIERNMAGEMSRDKAQTSAPPTMPQSIARKVSSGSAISKANTRG